MASQKLFNQEQIQKIAESIRDQISNYAPGHIANAILNGNQEDFQVIVTSRKDGWSARMAINLDNIPDARAQEYGSGENATRGAKNKYLIVPKNKKALAFHWEKANRKALQSNLDWRVFNAMRVGGTYYDAIHDGSSFQGFASDGRLKFNWVMHPGIKPYNGTGYIKPGIDYWVSKRMSFMVEKPTIESLGKMIREAFSFRVGGKVSKLIK